VLPLLPFSNFLSKVHPWPDPHWLPVGSSKLRADS
jgi:hypothetical protein